MFETVRARPAGAILPGDVPLTLPLLARSYLLPPAPDTSFTDALRPHLGFGPWAGSFAVAPGETARVVERALRDVMMGTATLRPDAVDVRALDPQRRAHRHLSALLDLWNALGDLLPPELAILRAVIEARADDILDPLHVIHDPQDTSLSAIEAAVIETVIARHGLPADIADRRAALRAARDACHGAPGTALRHLQAALLSPQAHRVTRDPGVRVFGLRDAEAEAHVAASLAQRLLDAEPDLSPSGIGLLLPSGPTYVPFVREAFARAGLPLSALPVGQDARDLAGECLLHVLTCLRPSAPVMARASLLRLALMPWPAEVGRRLSQAAMEGASPLSRLAPLDRRGHALLALLAERPTRAHDLAQLMEGLPRLLSTDAEVAEDVAELAQRIGELVGILRAAPPAAEITWDELTGRIEVAEAKAEADGPALLDAVTVCVDGTPPDRPVRHLMLLGFAEGAFPASPGIGPVFLDSEIALTRARDTLVLEWPAAAVQKALIQPDEPCFSAAALLATRCHMSVEAGAIAIGGKRHSARVSFCGKTIPPEFDTPRPVPVPTLPRLGRRAVAPCAARADAGPARLVPSQLPASLVAAPDKLETQLLDAAEWQLGERSWTSAAARGTALHEALRLLLMRPDLAPRLPAHLGLVPEDAQILAGRAQALRAWLAARGHARITTEVPMEATLAGGARLSATLDLLAEGEAGLALIDHKSDADRDFEAGFRRHWPQLSAYVAGLRALDPRRGPVLVAIHWVTAGMISFAELQGSAPDAAVEPLGTCLETVRPPR
ncbi:MULTISPECIES: PD-(D/E)XK nuclease family protein [unclassified Xanthobacter]|uniref:PD-(D/E)XK nuclease family protein n=1 Tax=unclassified Xanthobacter TaxID=2623496 RepID=UPI001F43A581|nr:MULTISPECIES: PD-(D/E)XK nuclease family protein [unclassified Xanthobacter]